MRCHQKLLIEMPAEAKGRHRGLDILRLLAVVMVIGIHTAGGYFVGDMASLSERWQAAPWYALSVGAVPLFVMMSGAFMLSSERAIDSWADYYKRSIGRKILLPLLVWSIGYYFWFCLKEQAWQPFRWHHLWYLVMLAELYAITPLLRQLCNRIESSHSTIYGGNRGLLLLTLVSYIVALSIDIYYRGLGVQQICLLWWVQYLPYYLASRLLSRIIHKLPNRCWLLAMSLGSTILYGVTLVWDRWSIPWQMGVNFSPLVVVKVVSLFALCYGWCPASRLSLQLSRLYPLVMGTYLVHLAVLNVIFKLFGVFLPAVTASPALSIPLCALLIALISFGITRLMRSIPLLRPLV